MDKPMTVGELIKELKKYDPNLPVRSLFGECSYLVSGLSDIYEDYCVFDPKDAWVISDNEGERSAIFVFSSGL